jgi:hypothetical protein
MLCMPRPRITYDVPEEIRRALLIYAAEMDHTVGEVIEQMTRKFIPDHVDRAKQLTAKHPPTPPRGRAKKS